MFGGAHEKARGVSKVVDFPSGAEGDLQAARVVGGCGVVGLVFK